MPSIAPPRRHAKDSLGAAACEVLVSMTFPFKPQFEPKHGAYVGAVVVAGVEVTKKPC
jgi:hypothetical protein